MSDPVEAVVSQLLGTTAVTDLVGTRIYYEVLPQAGMTEATLPAITVEQSDMEIVRHLAATTTLRRAGVNVNCYAASHASAVAVGDAVTTALEFGTGTWGTVTVGGCYVQGQVDIVDPPRDGSSAFRRIRTLLCTVWHSS